MRIRSLFLILAFVVFSLPTEGAERFPVREVVDGDTVILVDGRQVRMTGIQAPKLPLGRTGFVAWPLAAEAKAALEAMSRGRSVELHIEGEGMDRHGRVLAHLVRDDGLWLQGEMIRLGLARVYTFADNRARADKLYALEREARAANRGIWAEPFYAVRTPWEAKDFIGSFQLVEGRVVDAARVKGTVYLNFGQNWRNDFTVAITRRTLRLFEETGSDPLSLKGRTIRARGWLKEKNGPMIEATHPEQIESFE